MGAIFDIYLELLAVDRSCFYILLKQNLTITQPGNHLTLYYIVVR